MGRRLIVNADDYGRTPGVSYGILEAHRAGIVTSTTVMINQPSVEDHLVAALAQPELGVGLHLVFTAWKPVLPPEQVPDLIDESGNFLEQHTMWARADRIPVDQLRRELAAQVQRFAGVAGHLPDHLDCHHFVHLYPAFFEVYADLAVKHGLPLRVPFPIETDSARAIEALPYLEEFPRDLVRNMVATNSGLLRVRRLAYPDHFVGSFFGYEALTLDNLSGLLEGLPEGTTELMCHPGYNDPALAGSSYRGERELELSLLTDPGVRARLEALEIQLVTFAAFKEASSPA